MAKFKSMAAPRDGSSRVFIHPPVRLERSDLAGRARFDGLVIERNRISESNQHRTAGRVEAPGQVRQRLTTLGATVVSTKTLWVVGREKTIRVPWVPCSREATRSMSMLSLNRLMHLL